MTRCVLALKHFKRVDLHFYKATHEHHSSLPKKLFQKRTRAQLFESLVSTVISQQLGLAAADSIFARVKKACGGRLSPESVLEAMPAARRAPGREGGQVETLKKKAPAKKKNKKEFG